MIYGITFSPVTCICCVYWCICRFWFSSC